MENKSSESREELIRLAASVLKNYGVTPEAISVIQSGGIKTVWKIRTQNRALCLKRLKQSLEKALFSVHAQIYIKEKGGNVPAIIKANNNEAIVTYGDQLFVLYEWLEGTDMDMNNRSGLEKALEGLARFHVYSKGYEAPEGARVSSKLAKWPEQYASMRDKFVKWKEVAAKQPSAGYNEAYLKHADSLINLSNKALTLLQASEYGFLTSGNSNVPVLNHQDYGKGNAVLTGKGVFVIDLDGVTYDLPSRDLRKIIGKGAENKGSWAAENIEHVLECYTRFNSMSQSEKKVLYIDLMFPHWFYGLVKNLFINGKPLKAAEIERISKLEISKIAVLDSLIKGVK